jgi:hypothetical protein
VTESFRERMLRIVNDDLEAVHYEMKELDRLYIEKQKQVRQLKKAKRELEAMEGSGETSAISI